MAMMTTEERDLRLRIVRRDTARWNAGRPDAVIPVELAEELVHLEEEADRIAYSLAPVGMGAIESHRARQREIGARLAAIDERMMLYLASVAIGCCDDRENQ
jgi:hypothetical protein